MHFYKNEKNIYLDLATLTSSVDFECKWSRKSVFTKARKFLKVKVDRPEELGRSKI